MDWKILPRLWICLLVFLTVLGQPQSGTNPGMLNRGMGNEQPQQPPRFPPQGIPPPPGPGLGQPPPPGQGQQPPMQAFPGQGQGQFTQGQGQPGQGQGPQGFGQPPPQVQGQGQPQFPPQGQGPNQQPPFQQPQSPQPPADSQLSVSLRNSQTGVPPQLPPPTPVQKQNAPSPFVQKQPNTNLNPPIRRPIPQPKPPRQDQDRGQFHNDSLIIQKRRNEELNNVRDENARRVLFELSKPNVTPAQSTETMGRIVQLIGPLFFKDFDQRKEHITLEDSSSPGKNNLSHFPQRLVASFMDIKSTDIKAALLQRQLDFMHPIELGRLSLAMLYSFHDSVFRNSSGNRLAGLMQFNPMDATIAFKVSEALNNRAEEQVEFLQDLGPAMLSPAAQAILIEEILQWWGDPNQWKDTELTLLTSSSDPLLSYIPSSRLESLSGEEADRVVQQLGQTTDIWRFWSNKPQSLKKAWFELAKRARFFGELQDWSFLRMQKVGFLLEGASPTDLQNIPDSGEIKNFVIVNKFNELQARVIFDVFYKRSPLSQNDLQEFQKHVLSLLPTQLQRFDLADSFKTLDDMMGVLETQENPSFAPLLQIAAYMWPLVNSTQGLVKVQTPFWQKREVSQMGKLLFLLPKEEFMRLPRNLFAWDSNVLSIVRSKHLTTFQIWHLTSQILKSVDERVKNDYVFLMPPPFQRGIPSENLTTLLLSNTFIPPETLKALITQSSGMLTSQKAMIIQRVRPRMTESTIIQQILSSSQPSELLEMISPREMFHNIEGIIKTAMSIPVSSRPAVQESLPRSVLTAWLRWVRENAKLEKWTAEDLLGRSPVAGHGVQSAVLGLTCSEVSLIDPLDIIPVIMHYRNEIKMTRKAVPNVNFCLNLRSCFLDKIVEYLKIKRNFRTDENQGGSILGELNHGEIVGIGGEILSLIPQSALENVNADTRLKILETIGRVSTLDLFHLMTPDQLHWYAKTLFKDHNDKEAAAAARRRRRRRGDDNWSPSDASHHTPSDPHNPSEEKSAHDPSSTSSSSSHMRDFNKPENATVEVHGRSHLSEDGPDPTEDQVPVDEGHKKNATEDHPKEDGPIVRGSEGSEPFSFTVPADKPHSQSQFSPVDTDLIEGLGNLLWYAEDIFSSEWQSDPQFFKDAIESKVNPGEKTCCVSSSMRKKWFTVLQKLYGEDVSAWTEFDLGAIGDLLLTLPDTELARISIEAMASAVHPIIKQSGFDKMVTVPGQNKKQRFITVCTESLAAEGMEMMTTYKALMRRITQGAEWLVSTTKSPEDLIKSSVGKTGRLPRWAEFTTVKGQPPQGYQEQTHDKSFEIQKSKSFEKQFNSGRNEEDPGRFSLGLDSDDAGFGLSLRSLEQAEQREKVQIPSPSIPSSVMEQQPSPVQPQPNLAGQFRNQQQFAPQPQPGQMMRMPNQFVAQPQNQGQPGNPQLRNIAPQAPMGRAVAPSPPTGRSPQQGPIPASGQQQRPIMVSQSNQMAPIQGGGRPIPNNQFAPQNQALQAPSQMNQGPMPRNAPMQQMGSPQGQGQVVPPSMMIQPGSQSQQRMPSTQGMMMQEQGVAGPGNMMRGQQAPPPQFGPQSPQSQFGAPPQLRNVGDPQPFPPQGAMRGQQFMGPVQQGQPAPGQPPFNQVQPGQFQQPQGIPPGQFQQQFNPQGQLQPQPGQPGTPPNQPSDLSVRGIPTPVASQILVPGAAGAGVIPAVTNGTNLPNSGNPQTLPEFGPGDERTRAASDDSITLSLTCNAIKTAGPAAIGLTIEDIQQLSAKELFDCVESLGRLDYDDATKVGILTLLAQQLNLTFSQIPTVSVIELGYLLSAIKVDEATESTSNSSAFNVPFDLTQMEFKIPMSFDKLSILGSKISDPPTLKVLADKFNAVNQIFPGNPKKLRPDNLRIIVQSLGNILCGFSDKVVNSIFETDITLFSDCSSRIGDLEGCSPEVLSTLATHAIRPSNYGPPRVWSAEELATVGVVFAGLQQDFIATIPPEAMRGLQPHAIRALPSESIGALTSQQISKMSYNAAKAMTQGQINRLTEAQNAALLQVLQVQNPELIGTPAGEESKPEETRNIPPAAEDEIPKGRGKDDGDGDVDPGTEPPTTDSTTEPPSSSTDHPDQESDLGTKSSSGVLRVELFTFLLALMTSLMIRLF